MSASSLDVSQTRTFHLQVFRNGVWVDVPVESAKGTLRRAAAGQLSVVVPKVLDDNKRSRLFEGEKVRAFRGLVGAPQVRCWTGYVDLPTANNNAGVIGRTAVITDHFKELNDSIVIAGIVYDTMTPGAACVDAISKAISTGQFNPTDDTGAANTSTSNYNTPAGNTLCYFPDLFNADGSQYILASGALGSFTNGPYSVASFMVPYASGSTYSTFQLPSKYLIASMTSFLNFSLASATALPPASGTVIVDYFNGICYFNNVDASKMASLSATYYNSPNFAYEPGAKVGDILTEIMDKTGFRWTVDGFGKINARYIDATVPPRRTFNTGEFINLQVQTNRERRNVIICEGWDGNCNALIISKAINWDDINNAPPRGLGKRQYMVLRDPIWNRQSSCNAAAYFAATQLGRRGKIMATDIIDDPSLNLEDAVMFDGPGLEEINANDIFYVDSLSWELTVKQGGITARSSITGTGLPTQGTFYVGPVTNVTGSGDFDFAADVRPITGTSSLSPAGGTAGSTFSKTAGLTLGYTANSLGTESIDIYGSDNTHLGPFVTTRAAGTYNVALPVASMTVGITYAIRLRFMDQSGTLGIYRDLIKCRF